jgi:hypothetical protein
MANGISIAPELHLGITVKKSRALIHAMRIT